MHYVFKNKFDPRDIICGRLFANCFHIPLPGLASSLAVAWNFLKRAKTILTPDYNNTQGNN